MDVPVEEDPPQKADGAPRKRLKQSGPRTSRACLHCRKQKMRCEGADDPPCKRCRHNNIECAFERRVDYMLNPEDSAWQNRMQVKLDAVISTVDALIAAMHHQGPVPPFIVGPPGMPNTTQAASPSLLGPPQVSPDSAYNPLQYPPVFAASPPNRNNFAAYDQSRLPIAQPTATTSRSLSQQQYPASPDRPPSVNSFPDSVNFFAQSPTADQGPQYNNRPLYAPVSDHRAHPYPAGDGTGRGWDGANPPSVPDGTNDGPPTDTPSPDTILMNSPATTLRQADENERKGKRKERL